MDDQDHAGGKTDSPLTREAEMRRELQRLEAAQDRLRLELLESEKRISGLQQQLADNAGRARRAFRTLAAVTLAAAALIVALPRMLAPRGGAKRESVELNAPPVPTPQFDGEYVLDSARSFTNLQAQITRASPDRRQALSQMLNTSIASCTDFRLRGGIITCGKPLVQEYRIIGAVVKGGVLEGQAVWREDISAPGNGCIIGIRLELKGQDLVFSSFTAPEDPPSTLVFRRKDR